MTRSAYDSTLTPGPPLPKSHPPTSLLAKLYLHAASLYTSAHSLVNSAASSGEVAAPLRKYLAEESTFCSSMGHKWLGVDAGEAPGRCGESVALLKWSKTELETLKQSKLKLNVSKNSREHSAATKDRLAEELDAVKVFLNYYQKMNDSVRTFPYAFFIADTDRLLAGSFLPRSVQCRGPRLSTWWEACDPIKSLPAALTFVWTNIC